MKIRDVFEGKIEGVDEKGRPYGIAGSKTLGVPFSVPGDTVKATVTARVKGNLRGRLEEVLTPSPSRVTPRCPYASKCGGCPWQMIDYGKQAELKWQSLEPITRNLEISQSQNFIPARELFYHRNRMDYVFGVNGELGLKEPERWDGVINLTDCYMLSKDAVQALETIRTYVRDAKIPPWDNRTHTGGVRYVVIREGKNTNERLVMLITSSSIQTLPDEEKFMRSMKPLATTLIHGINPEITDLSTAKEMRVLFGNPYLTEAVGSLTYRIPPNSFFQTNSKMSEVLRDTVVAFADPKKDEVVLDLYCGGGFLSLALAQKGSHVIGVELDEAAIDTARENAKLNNLTNTTFSAGATENLLGITLMRDKPHTIVLDPPRAGLHPKALAALMEYACPRLVYVSCNSSALERDLIILRTKYKITDLRAIDLFPHTPHIETVVRLELL